MMSAAFCLREPSGSLFSRAGRGLGPRPSTSRSMARICPARRPSCRSAPSNAVPSRRAPAIRSGWSIEVRVRGIESFEPPGRGLRMRILRGSRATAASRAERGKIVFGNKAVKAGDKGAPFPEMIFQVDESLSTDSKGRAAPLIRPSPLQRLGPLPFRRYVNRYACVWVNSCPASWPTGRTPPLARMRATG
jgi:hypothetical protein